MTVASVHELEMVMQVGRWARCAIVLSALGLVQMAARAELDGSKADYERAAQLEGHTRGLVTHSEVDVHWFGAGAMLWYRTNLGEGKDVYVVVNAPTGKRHEQAERPRDEESKGATTQDATEEVATRPGASRGGQSESTRGARRRGNRGNSPDGHWTALVRNYNIVLVDRRTRAEISLTTDGRADDAYEERELYWSGDSKKLAALKTVPAQQHKVYMVESSPKDQVQPKLHEIDYLKPGDQIAVTKPHLFDIEGKKEIAISDALFPTPWSIGDVRWDEDSSRFTFLYNQRGHQVMRVVGVDAETGAATTIVNEQSKTFIDYNGKFYIHYLPRTHEIIWMSERDGWNHLYLIDDRTGVVKNQITKGEWVVRGVEWVDEEKRQIWFRCGGIYPEQDPYYVHYCRVNFDGTGLVKLTVGDGTHKVEFSPDQRWLVDTYSNADEAPVHELRRADDGSLVCVLEKSDMSKLTARGWRSPEQFVAKGREGKTDIYGLIYRPMNYDAGKKYPVIEDIYAGPQDSFVPKEFERVNEMMKLAELGFIVVKIDGMGTSNRSKAFHDVCWHNLGDAGFPDRILWMKAAAAKDPAMDLSRVGIYGVSAGGQSALRALEAYGDFYKAAVSDCGCHDNRMDKIWWNELWMGWPVGPWYEEQSNVTNAGKMNGKLMLVVGELDTNVDPASTMQVVNALIKADKDFDLIVVPGANHGAGESAYGRRRRADFFVRNLIGKKPRHE